MFLNGAPPVAEMAVNDGERKAQTYGERERRRGDDGKENLQLRPFPVSGEDFCLFVGGFLNWLRRIKANFGPFVEILMDFFCKRKKKASFVFVKVYFSSLPLR